MDYLQQEIVRFAKILMAIASTDNRPEDLGKILALVTKELANFPVEKFISDGTPSLLFANIPDVKEFDLLFSIHLDVVQAKQEQFMPIEKDGRLYGRGAYDMKAAAAAMILLFKELAPKVSFPFGLQVVTDEEVGGHNGALHQLQKGVRSKFVIAGEPSNLKIAKEAKGMFRLTVTSFGKAAHAAHLWSGENAIVKMLAFLNTLQARYPIPKKSEWKTTVNISTIQTNNTAINKVPDHCNVQLDIRYIEEDKDTILDAIRSLIPQDFHFEVTLFDPSAFVAANNPYLKLLRLAGRKHLGRSLPTFQTPGASDVRNFFAYDGKGVEFGPMGRGHHSNEEWVDIQSLRTYYEILKEFLLLLENNLAKLNRF